MGLSLFHAKSKRTDNTAALSILSTSCGHMCFTYSYSFTVRKSGDRLLFCADCFADRAECRVEIEDQPITKAESETFFRILDEEVLLRTLKSYRKPRWSRCIQVADETLYSTLLRFADGTEYNAETGVGETMTAFFYRLARKYGEKAVCELNHETTDQTEETV